MAGHHSAVAGYPNTAASSKNVLVDTAEQTVHRWRFSACAKWKHREYKWQARDAQNQKSHAHRGPHLLPCSSSDNSVCGGEHTSSFDRPALLS